MNRKRTWTAAALAAAAASAGLAAWVRLNFVAITVDGMSMSPALYPGDKVLIRRGVHGLRRGRIVVVSRPDSRTGWLDSPPTTRDLDAAHWYIKRIVAVPGDPYPAQVGRTGVVPQGYVVVMGDHPRSEDSKQHGPCPVHQILGVQVRKLSLRNQALATSQITQGRVPSSAIPE
jgi:signal peptidase I